MYFVINIVIVVIFFQRDRHHIFPSSSSPLLFNNTDLRRRLAVLDGDFLDDWIGEDVRQIGPSPGQVGRSEGGIGDELDPTTGAERVQFGVGKPGVAFHLWHQQTIGTAMNRRQRAIRAVHDTQYAMRDTQCAIRNARYATLTPDRPAF